MRVLINSRRTRKGIIPLLFLILFFVNSKTADCAISVSQSLEKHQLKFEDSVRFEISLSWDGGQAAYLFYKPLEPSFENLRIGQFSSSILTSVENGKEKTTKRFSYQLMPTSPGKGRIEAVNIAYTAMPDSVVGELFTEPMEITIAQPIPPKQAGKYFPLLLFIAGIAVVGATAGVIFYMRKIRKSKTSLVSPEKEFLSQLESLRKESENNFKKFQSGIQKLFASYLLRRHGITITSISGDEIRSRISKISIDQNAQAKITDLLVKAQEDKFRPVAVSPGEMQRLANEVKELIEKLEYK